MNRRDLREARDKAFRLLERHLFKNNKERGVLGVQRAERHSPWDQTHHGKTIPYPRQRGWFHMDAKAQRLR